MLTDQERLDAAWEVVSAANEIARNSKVKTAREACLLMMKCGVVCLPHKSEIPHQAKLEGTWYLCGQDKEQPSIPLLVLPIAEDDALLGMPYSRLWEVCSTYAYALYMQSNNTIFFRYRPDETTFVRACMLLHEAHHAFKAYEEGRVGKDYEDGITSHRLAEEVETHTQDHLLWLERGGSDYSDVIEKAVYRIGKKYRELRTERAFASLPIDGPWTAVLDSILGDPPYEKRRIARNLTFSVHAHFVYADRQSWPAQQKREHKMMVMNLIYKNLAPLAGQRIL